MPGVGVGGYGEVKGEGLPEMSPVGCSCYLGVADTGCGVAGGRLALVEGSLMGVEVVLHEQKRNAWASIRRLACKALCAHCMTK